MYKKSENKKKKLLLQQQYFNNTLDWKKKKICSVCTTCFCSGCGFGRVDAFLIQGYLRETYLPMNTDSFQEFYVPSAVKKVGLVFYRFYKVFIVS